jgi:hypothetical protein
LQTSHTEFFLFYFQSKIASGNFALAVAAGARSRLAAFSEKNRAPNFSSSKKPNDFYMI